MSKDDSLVIINESFKKEGSEEDIEGLTIMIDGVIKQVFNKIRNERNYNSNNEVMRDIIFEGINSIVKNLKALLKTNKRFELV
ncbi:hypothetical protein ABBS62_18135 [Bacillus subtilis subsp. subtilis]